MARFLAIFLLVVVLIALTTTETESVITCGTIVSRLTPCIPYAQGKGPLSSGCCTGMKQLNAAATSTVDRQQACNCLKSVASKMTNLNFGLISGAPAKCGVSIPYVISPSTDCAKVK